jgi:MFS transporter, UMF1 family
MASIIPAYACLGLVPLFERWGKGGLTSPGEMFGLAIYFGVFGFFGEQAEEKLMNRVVGSVYGAFQSYARAFYAELIPPGEEARWCVWRNIYYHD